MPTDLKGMRFSRLTALAKVEGRKAWLCRCDCGVEKQILTRSLIYANTRSCGCLAYEWQRKHGLEICEALTKHGETRRAKPSPEYTAWVHMKDRCYNANYRGYKDYGGRGIAVCDRWKYSFESFLEDMGRRPSSMHSLDRYPNNNGNYEPGNCRWATRTEQCLNRRPRRKQQSEERSANK